MTFRSYDRVMRGARRRLTLEIEMRNRQAWNTGNFAGGAMAGKLPSYDKCFGRSALAPGRRQPPAILAAMGRALAAVWGAELRDQPEGP